MNEPTAYTGELGTKRSEWGAIELGYIQEDVFITEGLDSSPSGPLLTLAESEPFGSAPENGNLAPSPSAEEFDTEPSGPIGDLASASGYLESSPSGPLEGLAETEEFGIDPRPQP